MGTDDAAVPRDDDGPRASALALRLWHLLAFGAGLLAALSATATGRSSTVIIGAFVTATALATAAFQTSFRIDVPRRVERGRELFVEWQWRERLSRLGLSSAALFGSLLFGFVLSLLFGFVLAHVANGAALRG